MPFADSSQVDKVCLRSLLATLTLRIEIGGYTEVYVRTFHLIIGVVFYHEISKFINDKELIDLRPSRGVKSINHTDCP